MIDGFVCEHTASVSYFSLAFFTGFVSYYYEHL